MYWRRFAVSKIPIDDPKAFEKWVNKVWLEKEALLEHFKENGRFPADEGEERTEDDADGGEIGSTKGDLKGTGFIEVEVRLGHPLELAQIFVVLGAYALVANILAKFWTLFVYGRK